MPCPPDGQPPGPLDLTAPHDFSWFKAGVLKYNREATEAASHYAR